MPPTHCFEMRAAIPIANGMTICTWIVILTCGLSTLPSADRQDPKFHFHLLLLYVRCCLKTIMQECQQHIGTKGNPGWQTSQMWSSLWSSFFCFHQTWQTSRRFDFDAMCLTMTRGACLNISKKIIPKIRLPKLLTTSHTAACLKKVGTSSCSSDPSASSLSDLPWYGQFCGFDRKLSSNAFANCRSLQ